MRDQNHPHSNTVEKLRQFPNVDGKASGRRKRIRPSHAPCGSKKCLICMRRDPEYIKNSERKSAELLMETAEKFLIPKPKMPGTIQ